MLVTALEPLVAVEVVHPEGDTAAHDVAFVDDQVSVELPPLEIEVGLAVSVTDGGGLVLKLARWFLKSVPQGDLTVPG